MKLLSLLAVAVLSMPAAAQGDASFAAALGRLPSGLAVPAELKARPQKPPVDERPAFQVNEGLQVNLHGMALVLGQVIEPGAGRPFTGWMATHFDPGGEFQAMSVTFFGPEPEDIREIKYLATRRAATATGSRVDVYLYTTDGDGVLIRATHSPRLIGPDGIEVKLPMRKLDPLDPADQAVFIRILAQWQAETPS